MFIWHGRVWVEAYHMRNGIVGHPERVGCQERSPSDQRQRRSKERHKPATLPPPHERHAQ